MFTSLTLYISKLFQSKAQNCCLLPLKMLITPPYKYCFFLSPFNSSFSTIWNTATYCGQTLIWKIILILCTNEVKPVCIVVSDSQVHILFLGLSNIRKTQSYLTMAENGLICNSLILKERETCENCARTKDSDIFFRCMWRSVLYFFHIHLHIKHHILICLQRVPRD